MGGPEADPLNTSQLFRKSWQLFRSHLRIFIPLMGFPIACQIVTAAIMYFFLIPLSDNASLRETWEGTPASNRIGILLLFLASMGVFYRALGATTWAAAEFHVGRNPGIWEAFRHPHGKQARLFWLLFIVGIFSRGPLVFAPLLAGFGVAPAFPVAALEDLGVIKAIQRGDTLSRGKHGRVALFYLLNVLSVVAGVTGLMDVLTYLQDHFGKAWFVRPVFPIGFWIILIIPQFYMIGLTLNYFDMRARHGEWPSVITKDSAKILSYETES